MARTHHHDEKRFHPWKNPRSSDRAFRRLLELDPYRRGFYYCDYSSAGPRWFRSAFMERPARRATRELERQCKYKIQLDDVDGWPLARKPTIYWW